MGGEFSVNKENKNDKMEVDDEGSSNFPEFNVQGTDSVSFEKGKKGTSKKKKGGKKTSKDKEIETLSARLSDLEQKFNILAKFSAKVMHRSATTLVILQGEELAGQGKKDKKLKEYKDVFQFLVDDWDKMFG